MKKSSIKFFAIFILVIVVIVLTFAGFFYWHKQNELAKRENLARMMNVRITDYKYPSFFPRGYFDVALKPGMTLEEVHSIVKGYEKVLYCGQYHGGQYSEIYYYYGIDHDDEDTLRLEIEYNQEMKYESTRGEDSNSRTINEYRCTLGFIGKQ